MLNIEQGMMNVEGNQNSWCPQRLKTKDQIVAKRRCRSTGDLLNRWVGLFCSAAVDLRLFG